MRVFAHLHIQLFGHHVQQCRKEMDVLHKNLSRDVMVLGAGNISRGAGGGQREKGAENQITRQDLGAASGIAP